ncbi:MAG: TetR/AcrR family transcriptional regulator [Bacteroidia bacterium]
MRAKEFNSNRFLEKAIYLFWEQGFNATGIKSLVETTGVNRFSIYEAFDNKLGVLKNAFELYNDRYQKPRIKLLNADLDPKSKLMSFFNSFINHETHAIKGCFMVAMTLEVGKTEKEIAEKLKTYIDGLKVLFLEIISDNKTADQLTALYCSGMCMSSFFSLHEMEQYFSKNLDVILNPHLNYA